VCAKPNGVRPSHGWIDGVQEFANIEAGRTRHDDRVKSVAGIETLPAFTDQSPIDAQPFDDVRQRVLPEIVGRVASGFHDHVPYYNCPGAVEKKRRGGRRSRREGLRERFL